MNVNQGIVYAVYRDDGSEGPGAQNSRTFPAKALLIFRNMDLAKEYERALRTFYTGRKNPRLTEFYSQDPEEILLSCHPAKVIEPISYSAK